MSFTYDLTTDIGKLRLRVPDSNAENFLFEDEEIQCVLDMNLGDLDWSLVQLYEILASKENTDGGGTEVRIGDIQINESKSKAKVYKDLADTLRKAILDGTAGQLPFGFCGGIYTSDTINNDEKQLFDKEIMEGAFTKKSYNDIIQDKDNYGYLGS